MKVGVGYGDNPETALAGTQAVKAAISQSKREEPCDMVMLFSTARHDPAILREAVASVVGESVPIYGGGAAGVITNDFFGYAGNQIGVACIWLDEVECNVLIEGGLSEGEEKTGKRLGERFAQLGTTPNSHVMLLYDAADTSQGFRLLMATRLLAGIEQGLGFLPNIVGAGMIGDHSCSPAAQWIGDTTDKLKALAFSFSENIRVNNVIFHGCHPSTQYYTVTKADEQVILEINGQPAIDFIDKLLDSAIAPEQYPFFLTFGVNYGERWGEFDEDSYASRLCLGIDRDRGGIVMFEPDMVEGTEFQLMYRSFNFDYIKPKIEKAFEDISDREPVFAVYIDCAGRSAGYGGIDMEDALIVQQAVAGRVPLLGLYVGVEIAPIGNKSRGLDWTGVLCLFSQDKKGSNVVVAKEKAKFCESADLPAITEKGFLDVMVRLNEQNAAKILSIDASLMTIRLELEQKRRGFALLAELASSLHHGINVENVFVPTAKRINIALNMQRTIVLKKTKNRLFSAIVLQDYSTYEKAAFAERHITVPEELLDPAHPVLVTGADSSDRLKEFRELIGIPFFISSPIMLQGQIVAILITGRLIEAHPCFVRLNTSDVETIQAVGALLGSTLTEQRLALSELRHRQMVDMLPLACLFWDDNINLIDCNQEALNLFGIRDKNEFIKQFSSLSPDYQPNGISSIKMAMESLRKAFILGYNRFRWLHISSTGDRIPVESTLMRIPMGGSFMLVGYIRDMREQEAAVKYANTKNKFLASVSHELRTPLNAIRAMACIVSELQNTDEVQKDIILRGKQSVKLLTSTIESILDFSRFDSGQLTLETSAFSVRELVENVRDVICKEAEEKSLYFNITVDPDIPDDVQGDVVRLRQVLFNIVTNAVKFTETGGVDIRVYRENRDRLNECPMVFEVKDTGIGINNEYSEHLFEPLFVGDMSYTRKYGGLGMGLAISYSLITLMGGEITYESRAGKGTTFFVHVSLSLPLKKDIESDSAVVLQDSESLQGLRVLVAEDNKINQMITTELLTSVGIEVTLAENGVKVLEQLQNNVFDLILMDIQMPEMDGLTATAQIRSDSQYDDLPILAMTANVGTEYVEESKQVGMNAYLTKPVNKIELYRAIKKWGKH